MTKPAPQFRTSMFAPLNTAHRKGGMMTDRTRVLTHGPSMLIAFAEHDITQAMECTTAEDCNEYLEDALERLSVLRRLLAQRERDSA